jgi:outer membrane receptor protein involved in Fe transport
MRHLGRQRSLVFARYLVSVALMTTANAPWALSAQVAARPSTVIGGRVSDSRTDRPIVGATVSIEGTRFGALTDSLGDFTIRGAPAGTQVLRAQYIGFSPSRITIDVPSSGWIQQNVSLARHALELKGVQVTADPRSRATGELGTASVIEHEAIRAQTATSLAGVLELVPGVPLQAPGLDDVQQISLRSVPVSVGDPSSGSAAGNLASFGTLIILDGVPLSNNSNLQTVGANQVSLSSSAGGGIDLRRIPATTIERVEVIRGIPSARFGDATQGAIIVDTRAGVVRPELSARFDASTSEASGVGGTRLGARSTGTITTDIARTHVGGGARNDQSTRLSGQVANRLLLGHLDHDQSMGAIVDPVPVVLDSRFDFFRLNDDRPEVSTLPGAESRSHDSGVRFSERVRARAGKQTRIELTTALDVQQQNGFVRSNQLRGATPVTDRLTAGRSIGRFLAGIYNARTDVGGLPRLFYSRLEATNTSSFFGRDQLLRIGGELRSEGNQGSGYQFDIEFPPQSRFNGVRGFDRPRAFSDLPTLQTSSFYVDDRLSFPFDAGPIANVQVGARLDAFHTGNGLFAASQDHAFQPRVNGELVANNWLTLRGGWGRLAKVPSLGELSPSKEYFDVINVNYFANNPAERLAVLTTYLFDPVNPNLGYSTANNAEAGFETRLGSNGASFSFTLFRDAIAGGVGTTSTTSLILREHFALSGAVLGSGKPPVAIEPAQFADSIPILISSPANNTSVVTSGFEAIASLPEIPRLQTRFMIQAAYASSRVSQTGIQFAPDFEDFELQLNRSRSPYYESIIRTGRRLLVTTRIIHQQPVLGLIITGTLQHTLGEKIQNIGPTDSLSFAGYVTRSGTLVPVPAAQRGDPQYADVRAPRKSILATAQVSPADWLFSFQVSKTLPLDGRFSFFAFNSFDRQGRFGSSTTISRPYQSTRFGLELTVPLAGEKWH